jgi:DNA-binding beta-propeller fold protein YncE
MKLPSWFRLFAVLISAAPSFVFSQPYTPFKLYKKVPVPGNGGYDYLKIDASSRRLYVSHGNSVNVFDLDAEKLIGSIDNLAGVHGIAIAPAFHKGFISDGKANSVVVFDLKTLKVIKSIAITGKDPDAIMYDPFSKRVFTFNGDSQDASVIDVESLKQVGEIPLGGTPEFAVSDEEGKIYNNSEDKNVINIIDAKTLKIIKTFPLDPCGGPTGLALDKKNQRLFTVCRENKGMSVLDARSGKIIATLPIGAGVDAVTYDESTGLVFCSNGDGTATIIHQESPDKYVEVQTLETQWKARTHALDPKTKKLYFSAFDMDPGNKNRIPDSFKILIYKQKP